MVLRCDAAAALGLLALGGGLIAPAVAFPLTSPAATTRPLQLQSSSTSLNNMLRDYADNPHNTPSWDPQFRSDRSGASSTNWRKNQGYNLSKPTPPEMGGSWSNPVRDAETNPYYDPGWAQSIRRDNPSQNFESSSSYNGYNDPYNSERYGGSRSYRAPSTFPGMTTPRRTDRVYTNPTNPYYDPLWSQSYMRNDEPIREGDHAMYYAPGYDRNWVEGYYGGGGGYYGRGGYGGGRMYAVPPSGGQGKKKAVLNGNSLMRTQRNTLFQSSRLTSPNAKRTALQMAYFDGPMDWDYGFEPGMMPPPGYGRGMRPGGGVMLGTGGPYGANQMQPGEFRRGGGSGFRRGGMGGRPGGYGSLGQRSVGPGMRGMGPGMGPMGGGFDPFDRYQGPSFGRDVPAARMSLKDMAARTTRSFDAEVISSMNDRSNARSVSQGGNSFGPRPLSETYGRGAEPQGSTTGTASTSSQYVPLSETYGPGPRGPMGGPGMGGPPPMRGPMGGPIMDRSPPLNVGPPPPMPPQMRGMIDTSAVRMEVSSTIQAARGVRPSVALVTSKGVRKENSQGSGFVVAFDDAGADDEDDVDAKDKVHILTSAHVAPPGWKVSVTFPADPDRQYPATVVGRKLNSDLALLCVETIAGDEDPFPPPLVLSGDDISTETFRSDSSGTAPATEIGSPVYAFGYPMGVEGPTMTSGILSATTKGINYMDAPTGEEPSEISKSRPFENTSFVITDAAMAGGMSGGPLVNAEGVVLGINALVRPDLRALGNYAVSALECETFLEKLEDKRGGGGGRTKRVSARTVNGNDADFQQMDEPETSAAATADDGVAGFRVMLYGYSMDRSEATKILRRVAGLDELRAENAMRSANSFGAGAVDEFYVAEGGNRERAVKASRRSADELAEKLTKEGMMCEVEPLNLLK
ncbi:hypothetical protein ACHAXT_005903 [Thalassiosira profunda]